VIVAETPRLHLRQFNAQDAGFILELYTDPAFRANIGERGVHDLASAASYLSSALADSYARFGFGMYAVQHKEGTRPLGMCGLLRRDSHADVEIGFALLPSGRGHGYAREAAAAVLRLGIERFGLRRIVAITAPDNRDSIRILELLGFRFDRLAHFTAEGVSRLFILDTSQLSAES
jgi:[ribosomal protein S5]-alanine N-acetyltransferase